MAKHVDVRYEQAVYGSFPFWDRGYAILAQTPGCRPEWLLGLRGVCQRFGEPTAALSDAPALFTLELNAGPRLIVGVGPQGRDDRGRPGALAFHALFLDPHDFRRAGANPFDFASILRHDWTANDQSQPLHSGVLTIAPAEPTAPPTDHQVESIASALLRGHRVALESSAPIDELASQVWSTLPVSVRHRASVATWAFGNGNQFDLVALPRLAGLELDASYLDPTALADFAADAEAPRPEPVPPLESWLSLPPRWRRAMPVLGAAALLLGAGLGVAFRPGDGKAPPGSPPPAFATASTDASVSSQRSAPRLADYPAEATDPDERHRLTEGLFDLAQQLGAIQADAQPLADPVALMSTLAERVRYRGPWLSTAELAELAEFESGRGPSSAPEPKARRDRAAQALAWHHLIGRFATDRALPEGFRDGPLRWQLDTLAWSFHLDAEQARRRNPSEVPHALSEALAVDVSLRPNPLAERHPALTAYRDFLSRLPRR